MMDRGQVGRKVRCIPVDRSTPAPYPPGLEGQESLGAGGLGLRGVGRALFQRVMPRAGPSSRRRTRSCEPAWAGRGRTR